MTGKNFQKIRSALKVSQRSLALLFDVTDKTISAWERSERVSKPVALAMTLLELAERFPEAEQALKLALASFSSANHPPRARRA